MKTITRREKFKAEKLKHADLHPTTALVLHWILQCWLSGFMPSLREIGHEFGWNSSNAPCLHVRRLRAAGLIEEGNGKGLILTDAAMDLTN